KNFNIYCLEWSPQKMVFSVNDTIHYEYNPSIKNSENWPFNSDQYLILNIAVEPDISSDFVMDQLEIDYIRIYQAK
ncbi:MAG: family 16 glycosylhydrolase, partial [Candidatus Marinimicrobia bacterium]|nr:family 16 glycosylhydrolase [Candidatus Neomarinimicrobiota bacterium]